MKFRNSASEAERSATELENSVSEFGNKATRSFVKFSDHIH